jgi:hypothetical protein
MVYYQLSLRFSLRLVLHMAANTHRMCKVRAEIIAKVLPRTGREDPEGEKRYTATLSLTSALDGVGGQRHAPAA